MHTFLYRLRGRALPSDILSLVETLAEYKGRQNDFGRTRPETLDVLYETVSAQSTAASGEIEGIHIPPERLKVLMALAGTPHGRPEEEIAGYRDALRGISGIGAGAMTIISPDELVTPETILRLHATLYRYTASPNAGRWKAKNNVIEARYEGGEALGIAFVPPAAAVTPQFMNALCEELARAREEKVAPTLILTANFVLDFLCIHPFDDGNGRVARLLAHLLLTREGYTVGRYVPLERFILETKDAYYAALRESSSGWHDKVHDPDYWTRYFLNMLLRAYKEIEVRLRSISESRDHLGALIRDAAMSRGEFAVSDLQAAMPRASRAYIYRVLRDMLNENHLRRLSRGRYAVSTGCTVTD